MVAPADASGWLEPSEKTTAATISAHSAAAPTAQGHRLRRRGSGCMSGEYHWLPGGPA